MWFDVRVAMRRCLQRFDQQRASSRALQPIEFGGVDNHDRIAAMQSHVLRPIAVRQANELAEARFGVLKAPATARWLHRLFRCNWCVSGHADQNVTAPSIASALTSHAQALLPHRCWPPGSSVRLQIASIAASSSASCSRCPGLT